MKDFLKSFIVAIIVVFVILTAIKPTIVKEHSMEATLYENDYLLINKLAYISSLDPKHEDIIVFESDIRNEENGKKKYLIKRVVGVENDIIDIRDGFVYRNGEKIDEPYIKEQYTDGDITQLIVPKNQVFVMGDNREVSLDSRSEEVGMIDEDRILGKAFIRLYPFGDIGLL